MAGTSHPKYSDMIIEAIQANKEAGNLNTSRQAILKFITTKYGIEAPAATVSIKKNLKTMLETEIIKQAAADGRKGAGSFRLVKFVFSNVCVSSNPQAWPQLQSSQTQQEDQR